MAFIMTSSNFDPDAHAEIFCVCKNNSIANNLHRYKKENKFLFGYQFSIIQQFGNISNIFHIPSSLKNEVSIVFCCRLGSPGSKCLCKAWASKVAWRQFWNFIVFQVKFNRFLHMNEHARWNFWYLVKWFDATPSKINIFWFSKSIFKAKTQLNLSEKDFLFSICE